MDWPLALEFVKALAGRVATVAAVFIVARQARRTFAHQKALEKRLEWYERVHVLMDRLAKAYTLLQIAGERKEPLAEAAMRVQQTGLEFSDEADRAWLYAGRAGFHAVQRLNNQLSALHTEAVNTGFTTDKVEVLMGAYQNAAVILPEDLRQELGMESLNLEPRVRRLLKEYRLMHRRPLPG